MFDMEFPKRVEPQKENDEVWYLKEALIKFPRSGILKKIEGLSSEDKKDLDSALNMIGETFSLFGSLDEDPKCRDLSDEILGKIDIFSQIEGDQKQDMARRIAQLARV